MVIYAYAILPQPQRPLQLPQGLCHPVQLVTAGTLAAAVELDVSLELGESSDPQAIERQLQQVFTHDRVIQALFAQTTLLPLRFGIGFATLADIQLQLQTSAHQYHQQLAQLQGKAEYTLKLYRRVTEPIAPEPSQLKGRDYFLARKQQYQHQAEQQAQQNQELDTIRVGLTELGAEIRSGSATADPQVWHLLINAQAAEALYHNALTWQASLKSWELEAIGPLPPHHFMTA